MDSTRHTQSDRDETSLRDVFAILWNAKWPIFGVTLAFACAAGIGAWLTPNSYKAAVLLSPVSNSAPGQLGALGSLASQLGGLASLAGLSSSGDTQKSEEIAVLQSEALTEKYIGENDLLPLLYEDKWDAQNKRWKDTNPRKIPTLWKANVYFKQNVRRVTSEAKTGLVTLTITFNDPRIAAKWANDLVRMANDYLRNNAIAESERNIAYLNDQAARTSAVEARQAIYKILENEINKGMLARGNVQYAFKIIDPATAPERRSSPQMAIWLVAGACGGFFLAALLMLLRASWSKEPTNSPSKSSRPM